MKAARNENETVDCRAFGDVLAVAMVGTWRIEVDGGCAPRMYADGTMKRLIGLDDDAELSPEEIYRAWHSGIDPAHLDAIAEGEASMFQGRQAEMQYPWHHPDGRTIVVRCGGVRDMSYTKGVRVVGIHQWVTTMKHVDRVAEGQQHRLEEYKIRADVIKDVIKAGQWYYHLDAENRITIVSHNEDLCRLIDNEYEDGEDSWTKIIHPDDLPAAFKAFKAAIADRSGKTPYDVIFRIRNRNGGYKWFRSAGRVVRKEDGSGDFIGTLIDIDETVQRRDEAREIDRQYDALLHETIGATRWNYTISPSGEVTAARYGDRVVHCLGGNTGPMDWLRNVHPDDRERVEANFRAAVRDPDGKTPYEASFRLLFGDGTRLWAKSSGRIVLHADGSRELVGLSIDITDTIEEQRKRLLGAVPISLDVLDKANIGLWAFELDEGEPPRMYHDKTMLGLVGLDHQLPPEEAYHAWYDRVDKDCLQLVNDAVAKMMAGEHAEVQYPWHHPDGHTMIVRCGGVRNFSYTKGIRVEGTHQNVSAVLHYDEAEEKRRHELAIAKAANEAKTQFLFSMSHDIRTPMNAIKGFAEIAKKNLDDRGKLADCLNKIGSSVDLLLSLVNSVLDMSRVESGKAKLEEKAGDVMFSFASIEPTLQTLAKARDVALSFEFGRIVDRFVYVDFEKTNRVFVNLISNAIKYSKPNGWVRVTCEQVDVEELKGCNVERLKGCNAEELKGCNVEKLKSSGEGDSSELRPFNFAIYRYTFADNGIGMGEAFQKHLFEEFAREYSTTTSGIQGTGLGLALCKSFVDLMGGTITCRSKRGEGTTFVVELPFRVREDVEKSRSCDVEKSRRGDSQPLNPPPPQPLNFAGRRVLLVEDNELNREVATYVLEEQGFKVETADDGSVAVRLVKEKGLGHYDLVLMDIQMPVMNGYEATKAIRKWEVEKLRSCEVEKLRSREVEKCPSSPLPPLNFSTPQPLNPSTPQHLHLPIIALSANAFAEDKAASIAAGMDDHVAKPIKVEELMAVLSRCVRNRLGNGAPAKVVEGS